MIKYVKHEAVNRTKHDECIRRDPSGLVYGFSWFLDTVCESWDLLVLNDYEAVWPLPYRRKYGFKYFYRPYGVQQLGIFSPHRSDGKLLLAFVEEMQKNCHYGDLYLNEGQITDVAKLRQTESSFRTNFVLDLNRSYREIHQAFRYSIRRSIRIASEHGLELFERDGPRALLTIFKRNKGAALSLEEAFFRNMEKIMYRCLHNGTGKVWTAYGSHNSICAGAFFMETEKRHILLFTCLTDEGREKGAMPWLLNEYFIYHSGKDKTFDFEGSDDKGVALFYSGFGSEKKKYQCLQYNNLPLPIRWLKQK